MLLNTYKYRLYPNRKQKQGLEFTLERCRLLYNRLLTERIHAYKANTFPYESSPFPH